MPESNSPEYSAAYALHQKVRKFSKQCAVEGISPLDKIEQMLRWCEQCGEPNSKIERAGLWWCSEKCIADRIEILSNIP